MLGVDLLDGVWPPCWVMLSVFIIVGHVPTIYATSHVDHEKKVGWFSIEMHTVMWLFSSSYDAPLGGLNGAELSYYEGKGSFLWLSCLFGKSVVPENNVSPLKSFLFQTPSLQSNFVFQGGEEVHVPLNLNF